MKLRIVLVGALLATTAGAQERISAQPVLGAQPLSIPRNIQMADPQIALLKQQIAEIKIRQQEQQAELIELQKSNATLAFCLGQLKSEVKELRNPSSPGDSVTVQPPALLSSGSC